jgi:hypothetical protein
MSKHEQAKKEHGSVLLHPPGGETGPAVEQIAARAYELWENRGRTHGTDQQDWFEAERQLRGRAAESEHNRPHPSHGGRQPQDQRTTAEQARESRESEQARWSVASSRERMVDIGRGNQQAGRQGE